MVLNNALSLLDVLLVRQVSNSREGLAYTLTELYPTYIEITPDAVIVEPHIIHKMNMLHLN